MGIRRGVWLLCFLCGGLLGLNAGAQPADSRSPRAVSPAAQDEGHVLFLALDREGRPLPEPPKESFRLHLDGQAVEIEGLRPLKDEPLIFSMIVDESGSTRLFFGQQTTAGVKLFRALSTGNNHGYLVEINNSTDYESEHFLDSGDFEKTLREAQPRGSTALYDAIFVACTKELRSSVLPPNARRAIFVFSDGGDNSSVHSLSSAVEAAQREGIPIFPIFVSAAKDSPKAPKKELAALRTLSQSTGGLLTYSARQDETFDG